MAHRKRVVVIEMIDARSELANYYIPLDADPADVSNSMLRLREDGAKPTGVFQWGTLVNGEFIRDQPDDRRPTPIWAFRGSAKLAG